MKRRSGGEASFTLVELILVMVLVGIIAASTATVTLQGTRAYRDLVNRKEALQEREGATAELRAEVEGRLLSLGGEARR